MKIAKLFHVSVLIVGKQRWFDCSSNELPIML